MAENHNYVCIYCKLRTISLLARRIFPLQAPPPYCPRTVVYQEAKYVESWPNMTSAWAGWSRFDIPVDRYCSGQKKLDS